MLIAGLTLYNVFSYAPRFNATEGSYETNLPRFERSVETFNLSSKRAQNPDMELIQHNSYITSIAGGAFTAEDLKNFTPEVIRFSNE